MSYFKRKFLDCVVILALIWSLRFGLGIGLNY